MTNIQSKNKILIIFIGILLIANIGLVSFFLLNKKEQSKSLRQDKKEQVIAYLKKEVGFTDEQLSRYDTLSKAHRAKMKSIFDDMATGREAIFKQLASQSFTDSAINVTARSIAERQIMFEMLMLRHLKNIRDICTPSQQAVFDTGFYKIISKRGEGRNKNKDQHSN